ncbi:hypothetical protein ACFV3R_25005 [Streptomyces sp. NPDC059740]|uniref:hypothetical protein n=1 Tax=Streptomyces sp. NPDC059740 TaxID=3346926 RepID=UPI0036546858
MQTATWSTLIGVLLLLATITAATVAGAGATWMWVVWAILAAISASLVVADRRHRS